MLIFWFLLIVITYLLPVLIIHVQCFVLRILNFFQRCGILGQDYFRIGYKLNWKIYTIYMTLWHGHTIVGGAELPPQPCMLVAYHGAMPIDMIALMITLLAKGVPLYTVAAVSILRKLGLPQWLFDDYLLGEGTTRERCIELLKAGNSVLVAPGGVHEAQIADYRTYALEWKDRLGFAAVALAAGVPIIPFFTCNINEAYRPPTLLYALWRRLLKSRPPFLPPIGGAPVKLTSYFGPAVFPSEGQTPQQLTEKVQEAMFVLIHKHQKLPGSMLRGLVERFT